MAQKKKRVKHTLDEEYSAVEGLSVLIRSENGFSQRRYIRLKRNSGSHLVTYARYVWNQNHPNNIVKRNEEIHHIDGNALNDDISNLVKLKKKEHAALHQVKENDVTLQLCAAACQVRLSDGSKGLPDSVSAV